MHLVIRRLCVGAERHRLRPRDEQFLGSVRLVEVGHGRANVGRVPDGEVGLIGPKVEESHVARAVGPGVVEEELGKLRQAGRAPRGEALHGATQI